MAGLLPLPVTEPPPEFTDHVNGVPAREPPAVAPVSVTAALPLQELTVLPIAPVGGVVQLTVLVFVAVPVQGDIPVTVKVAVKEPVGLPPFGVNTYMAGSLPVPDQAPRDPPPVQTGAPVRPPPVAPVIVIPVPEPEQEFIVVPAYASGAPDQLIGLSLVIVGHGAVPTMVNLNVPVPPAEVGVKVHPVKLVVLAMVAVPVPEI